MFILPLCPGLPCLRLSSKQPNIQSEYDKHKHVIMSHGNTSSSHHTLRVVRATNPWYLLFEFFLHLSMGLISPALSFCLLLALSVSLARCLFALHLFQFFTYYNQFRFWKFSKSPIKIWHFYTVFLRITFHKTCLKISFNKSGSAIGHVDFHSCLLIIFQYQPISTQDDVFNNQSDFIWVFYMHHCEFPIQYL